MTIYQYGSPGPSRLLACALLRRLSKQISPNETTEYEFLDNHTEKVSGLSAHFTAPTVTGSGITRSQASELLTRLSELTMAHGAVGVASAELDYYGQIIELFELVWMFEGVNEE